LFSRWNVLDEPRRFRDEFSVWRDLLMIIPQNAANSAKRPEPGTQVRELKLFFFFIILVKRQS
jgi:hypothetical protein